MEEKKIIIGKRFEGKVAVLTASTKGIGFSVAHRLGLEGASVVISSRSQKNVDEAVEKLKAAGIQISGVVCHVSNAQHRKNLIQHTVQKYGKIDVMISGAGVNPVPGTILDTPESALDKLWDVNVKASIFLIKEAAPHLAKGSSIVLVSTASAYRYVPIISTYAVSKTALLGLTKALGSRDGSKCSCKLRCSWFCAHRVLKNWHWQNIWSPDRSIFRSILSKEGWEYRRNRSSNSFLGL